MFFHLFFWGKSQHTVGITTRQRNTISVHFTSIPPTSGPTFSTQRLRCIEGSWKKRPREFGLRVSCCWTIPGYEVVKLCYGLRGARSKRQNSWPTVHCEAASPSYPHTTCSTRPLQSMRCLGTRPGRLHCCVNRAVRVARTTRSSARTHTSVRCASDVNS